MKIYNLNGEVKWTKRVKVIIPILVFIIANAVLFPFFYIILSDSTELLRSILTSLVISTLITLDSIYTQVLNYEKKTVVIKNKKIYLITIQKETDFYGTDIKRNIDVDLSKKDVVDDILENQNKYVGISLYKIDKYGIINNRDSKLKLKIEGIYTKWKYKEEKRKAKYVLIDKNKKSKLIIDNKYENYEELIKYLKDKEEHYV